MNHYRHKILQNLLIAVEWFIPENLKTNAAIVQGARMFLFSHLFGPFLGHTISMYILLVQGKPDTAWWIFFGAITAFWPFPLILKLTGRYVPLSLISIQNLIFCIFWGCYQYGGSSSPILPWMITVPLLAFFYLPTRRTRIMVSLLILVNIGAFSAIAIRYGFASGSIPLAKLAGLGMVSTMCAGIYVSMMALYYANVVSSQSELELEIQRHLATMRELRAATEEAERAMQAKSEFLAKVSHELRTPLNAILGYSEMLLEDSAESEVKSADLLRIHDAGKNLLGLINNLLDLSKLEAGKTEVNPEAFELAKFLNSVAADWRPAIADAGITLHLHHRSARDVIVNDAPKLRRAIDNLLSNAIKFAKGGLVSLTASIEGEWLVLTVADTGCGISAERMATILDSFGTHASETASKYDEYPGLGVTLTQRLCSLMGGDLSVESEVGQGARFTIRVRNDLSAGVAVAAEPRPTADSTIEPPRGEKSILVVDDDPAALDLITRILHKEGFATLLSRDVVDAMSRARESNPAAIILDVRMAQPDGWEALRLIRQDDRLRSTKVILLTVDDDFAKGRVLGADAHLLKPIDKDSLRRCLLRLCPALRDHQIAEQREHPRGEGIGVNEGRVA
ncbi:MAG TPA: ATP-binding protein [Stellaceae bacterium]|nr:ATP-binding protein [Stellaceae bacterium]